MEARVFASALAANIQTSLARVWSRGFDLMNKECNE